MSTILAIETSAELASVALLQNGAVLTRESSGVTTHSQTVLPMVQAVLADAAIRLQDCDAIAYGAGPGSFTGVRTACGIAQGLGYGLQLPLLPVVTLHALALACHEKSLEKSPGQQRTSDILAVIDARMGEVYWAQYRFDGNWQTVIAPSLSAAAAVQPQGAVLACGNGLAAYADDFPALFAQSDMSALMPHARQIALLGAAAFARGEGVAASVAEPLYLRNKVALTSAERAEKNATEAA
jgi:tRNA threonylcarbamoyladenosine biosynthesis protein TsaB